ncbi:ATP-binding protein [Cellulomonas sp. DKR-3]|uniref:ATP-binding protein n=1 Tax=Cellulomonas fulva TaxID=2835530 RepID=A0ABS5TVC7_9CELL|nr:ATP-binding protein [Cellulomonas fulva]MBT0993104.1 ATP-binding protein [Cellulomonas fulva]
MTLDPFDTAALRAAVLSTWRSSPPRLREDANTEEDHARGYYRDRVVVELAQNAADAAVRAGVAGRLLLRLARTDEGTTLVAANTGAPLDAAGVAALSSMRASAKRDPAARGVVGRFGVGFAAVRAVSDEVGVLSTTGAVRFSLRDTLRDVQEAAAGVPALEQEVVRRDGSLPALRLPYPAEGRPPSGFDTAVVLQLRDEVAADEVRALLDAVDDALLLALPGLTEVVVEDLTSAGGPRRVADVASRWFVATTQGELPRELLVDRPVEERDATAWRITWALPRSSDGALPTSGPTTDLFGERPASTPRVVHAPTPTDEPLDLPALLVATLPLDPTRRRVAAGPLTDALLRHAADAYAVLAEHVARAGGDPLGLVPTTLPAAALDAALRALLLDRLAATPLLTPASTPLASTALGSTAPASTAPASLVGTAAHPTAGMAADLVAGRRAVALDGVPGGAALAELGRRVAALVVVPPGRQTQARLLGVDVRRLADLVEELAADDDWPALYTALEALAATDPTGLEALGGLPVPLVDGRVVRGARGTVVVPVEVAREVAGAVGTLASWGVRVVEPTAAHPLLERLGAQAPDAPGLLRLPAVREAVLAWDDEDDEPAGGPSTGEATTDLTGTVLTLVRAALPPRDPSRWTPTTRAWDALPDDVREWLALLPVRAANGERAPADGLVLPGSPAHRLLDERVLSAVATEEVERWGAAALVAAGVREELVTVTVPEVVTDEEPAQDAPGALVVQALDGWPEYLDHLSRRCGPGAYVGDVVAVADLDAVATDAWPGVLELLTGEPALRRALLEPVRSDRGAVAQSYAAWWLRERSPLGLPARFVVGDAGALADLLPPAPPVLAAADPQAQQALGGVASAADLTPEDWTELLDAWPAGRPMPAPAAAEVWRHAQPDEPPDRVPALVGRPGRSRVLVVPAHDAAVAASPMWWQRTDVAAVVPARDDDEALRLARALDLPRVSELAAGAVTRDEGIESPLPDVLRDLLPGLPATWCEHEDLRVDHVPVEWWVDGGDEPRLHATTLAGLAAAAAQAGGRWGLRYALEAVLDDEDRAAELLLDTALDAH